MTYDAVIFDNDGVLTTMTDHERIQQNGTEAAFAELGYELGPDAMREITDSVGGTEAAIEAFRSACHEYGVDPDRFWRTRERLLADEVRTALRAEQKRLQDDVPSIFDLDAEFAIVSNTQHRTLEHIVEHFSWEAEFAAYYGRDPTLEGLLHMKPDPYYVEQAMADLDGENVLFVGDSSNDVDAARNVGIDSAFVRRPRKADLELANEPTYEITSLEELSGIV